MKRKLVFASTNRGKFEEVRTIAAEFPKLEVLFPADLGIGVLPDVEEVEDSYEGNARLKAKSCFQWCQIDSFADDAGIEVETLNGRPGVRSARYAGDHATSEENLSKLLSELKNSDNRAAKFVSVIVAFDGKSFIQARGELKGKIAAQAKGEGGFGYDPIVIPDGFTRSLAELKADMVEIETHRIKALRDIFKTLARQ